jgi:hypothetical protein
MLPGMDKIKSQISSTKFDIAAKRRKMRKSQISHLVFSIGYEVKIREF